MLFAMSLNARTLGAIVALVILLFSLSGCSAVEPESRMFVSEKIRTHAVYVPERKDDFAWENDLVAFRAYGPSARDGSENNGIDPWFKYVSVPVVDQRYHDHLINDLSYHKDWGNGYDIYHVGSSLGIGGEALWLDGRLIGMETWVEHTIVSQTREKVDFLLVYELKHGEDLYKQEKYISLSLGSQLFSVRSIFYKNGELAKGLHLGVGVATHDGQAEVRTDIKTGFISAWETLSDNYGVGWAVLVSPDRINSAETILIEGQRDSGHQVFVVATDGDGEVTYHAGFAWQRAGIITDFDQWLSYLKNYKG